MAFPGRLRWFALYVLPVLWIGGVGGGMLWLWQYASSPGHTGEVPAHWPRISQIVPATDRPTLVMFAHPKCPCTRASIAELARAMAACRERVAAHVVFFVPADATPDWERTDLTHAAESIPGVRITFD